MSVDNKTQTTERKSLDESMLNNAYIKLKNPDYCEISKVKLFSIYNMLHETQVALLDMVHAVNNSKNLSEVIVKHKKTISNADFFIKNGL